MGWHTVKLTMFVQQQTKDTTDRESLTERKQLKCSITVLLENACYGFRSQVEITPVENTRTAKRKMEIMVQRQGPKHSLHT